MFYAIFLPCLYSCCSFQDTDWTDFHFTSTPDNRPDVTYHHTLSYPLQNVRYSHYKEFDTLIHCTSFENAQTILEDDCLKPGFVKDSSVINPNVQLFHSDKNTPVQKTRHPLEDTEILWYGPLLKKDLLNEEKSVERYGNVVFSMNTLSGYEGIERDNCSSAFKYYFIETVHYVTQTATRILVTPSEYPSLLRYDPEQIGGPWHYDRETRKHYCLQKCQHVNGNLVSNTLEILKEQPKCRKGSAWIWNIWQKNHFMSYLKCHAPRKGVTVSEDNWKDGNFRLALGVSAYMIPYENDRGKKNFNICGIEDIYSSIKANLKQNEKDEENVEEDKEGHATEQAREGNDPEIQSTEYKRALEWAKEQLVLYKKKVL